MAVFLVVVEGPNQGQKYEVSGGLKIGRGHKMDIRLTDPKVSSYHAVVSESEPQSFRLVDVGSSNGIKVDGKRCEQVDLKDQTLIQLGRTLLRVEDPATAEVRAPASVEVAQASAEVAEASATPSAEPRHDTAVHDFSEPPELEVEVDPPEWDEFLEEFTRSIEDRFQDDPQPVVPLDPAVRLRFVRGLQVETEWTIGYGPRKIGAKSFDLPILEPNAPDVCFELRPGPDGVVFATEHPQKVKLNESSVKTDLLKAGDTISVFDTVMAVDLII